MFNVQRLLGDRIGAVVDAMQPGGSGDQFSTPSLHERQELCNLYRLGFPRGGDLMLSQTFGQICLWTSHADSLAQANDNLYPPYRSRTRTPTQNHTQLVSQSKTEEV